MAPLLAASRQLLRTCVPLTTHLHVAHAGTAAWTLRLTSGALSCQQQQQGGGRRLLAVKDLRTSTTSLRMRYDMLYIMGLETDRQLWHAACRCTSRIPAAPNTTSGAHGLTSGDKWCSQACNTTLPALAQYLALSSNSSVQGAGREFFKAASFSKPRCNSF